jgi:hypothetical protein
MLKLTFTLLNFLNELILFHFLELSIINFWEIKMKIQSCFANSKELRSECLDVFCFYLGLTLHQHNISNRRLFSFTGRERYHVPLCELFQAQTHTYVEPLTFFKASWIVFTHKRIQRCLRHSGVASGFKSMNITTRSQLGCPYWPDFTMIS